MNDEELKQRIKYLVEHGGLWEDPLADVRRSVRAAVWMAGGAAGIALVEMVVHLL
jgi:hypothetical protein